LLDLLQRNMDVCSLECAAAVRCKGLPVERKEFFCTAAKPDIAEQPKGRQSRRDDESAQNELGAHARAFDSGETDFVRYM
jgi:hypothetical protein